MPSFRTGKMGEPARSLRTSLQTPQFDENVSLSQRMCVFVLQNDLLLPLGVPNSINSAVGSF